MEERGRALIQGTFRVSQIFKYTQRRDTPTESSGPSLHFIDYTAMLTVWLMTFHQN